MALPLQKQIELDAINAEEKAGEEARLKTEQDGSQDNFGYDTGVSTPAAVSNVVELPKPSSEESFARLEARLEAMQSKLEDLFNENARLKKAAENPTPAPSKEVLPEELNDSEKEAYKQSLPIIEKIANKRAYEATREMRSEIQELKTKLESTQLSYTNMSESMFANTVRDKVPEMAKKMQSQKWHGYLNSKIPRTNLNVGQALMEAHNSRNLDAIKEIFDGLQLASEELSKQAVPSGTKTSEAPKELEKLKFTDRKSLSLDYQKGRITKERFDELVKKYDLAEAEGRVNFNS